MRACAHKYIIPISDECNNKPRGDNVNDETNHFNLNIKMNTKYNFKTDEQGYLPLIQIRIMQVIMEAFGRMIYLRTLRA